MRYDESDALVDSVVRDVFNMVPIFWIAQKYGIPLKTKETPHGEKEAMEEECVAAA